MKLNHITAVALALCIAAGGAFAAEPKKGQIKKCQDAQGRWHYGDTAADECSKSKITEINRRGLEVREIDAPLTPEQLKAKEAQQLEQERETKRKEEQARRDKILLGTYASEQDLVQTRDRKLSEVDVQIKASQDTLAALRAARARYAKQAAAESAGGRKPSTKTAEGLARTDDQIAKQEQFIQAKQKDQDALRTQFATDLARFREMKNPSRR